MVVSIHQPYFFPWLGYLNKVVSCDKFVILDDVQFRKGYFQNRAHIKNSNSEKVYLTLPVVKSKLNSLIYQIKLTEKYNHISLYSTLVNYYKTSPYWHEYKEDLKEVLFSTNGSLDEIVLKSMFFLFDKLDNIPTFYNSSELDISENDPTLRLVKLCKELEADTYLSGKSGKDYLDLSKFKKEGINVEFQDFDVNKLQYDQIGDKFVSGLSAIDVLLNSGITGLNKLTYKNDN